ncbi:MAG TPA: sigma-70 family RNA polymerase sigma factor [Chitinophaga sp.]
MAISPDHINQLTDHLFRREAGKMVAVLTRIFGAENLETAEDVVQDTLLHAMQSWTDKGIPDNPSAWLFRVARNKAIDIIRRNKHSVQFDFSDDERILLTSNYSLSATMDHFWQEAPVKDDMLRMMFACCHPGVSEENQVTIILKTLCGFSTAEIAKAFLTSEDTISKRLYRTKEFFRDNRIKLEIPSIADMQHRTDAVLNAIYLLFNEGYNSTHSEDLIRRDVMEEAMLLCKLLTENAYTQTPEAFALMALMCFHASRTESRLSTAGEIILLQDQDRSKWDRQLIAAGNAYMERAAFGNIISRYHLEAAIAYEHCTAESYGQTNWERILEYYDWLCEMAPSAVTELNRAVVVMQVHGPAAALEELEQITDRRKLASFYLYNSLLGELYARLHLHAEARQYFEIAIAQTQSETEKRILRNKISIL